MGKKFFVLTLSIIILMTTVLSLKVSADNDYSFTVSMTSNNPKVSAGDEVLVTVKVSNLNVGANGINSFSAYLSYDSDIFETLTESSVDGINGWVPNYTTGTGKVQSYKQTFLKTDEEIMQISLKTKEGLPDGAQGDVKLSTIIVSNSSDEIMASPVSIDITIGEGSSASGLITPNSNSTVTPPLSINPTVNSTPIVPSNNTNTVSQNNVEQLEGNNVNILENPQNQIQVANEVGSDIPYTGTDSNALARIIIGVIFIGLVIYIKIEKMNRDIR